MKAKLLGMDVDGTLTDGKIYIGSDGEVMKAFDVKDGYGIIRFRQAGGIPVIITGRRSRIVEERCRELGINELHQGVSDKLKCLEEVVMKYQLTSDEIAYIGDDLNDIECMKYAGLSAAPNDAFIEAKNVCKYKCQHNGGRGAVREFIEYLFKI